MSGSEASETHGGVVPPPSPAEVPPRGTRFAFAAALVFLGLLLTVAARSDGLPGESRMGSRVELVELIRIEQARVDALQARVGELSQEVAAHQEAQPPGAQAVAALQEQLEAIAAPAGMTAVAGAGVVATLNDSTATPAPGDDLNSYVIHEQDLQAVINALWAGGAEAMAVNGERVLATTAIRCVGNTLLLHGKVYSPPYQIAAIGDELELRNTVGRDPAVQRFASAAEIYDLGWALEARSDLELAAYQGSPALQVARPVAGSAAG